MSTLFGYEVVEQAQEIDRLSTEIASLTGENKRLRALVEPAYREGFRDGFGFIGEGFVLDKEREFWWKISDTRAALQPKEGEG